MRSEAVTGVTFEYSGSLAEGLIVEREASTTRIPPKAIQLIRQEIVGRSPVRMGATRDHPAKDSVGETLVRNGFQAQFMSYVLPLLVEEGYCSVRKEGRGFVIRKV